MIPVKQKNSVKPPLTPKKLFIPPGNGKEATALKSQLTISQLEGERLSESEQTLSHPFSIQTELMLRKVQLKQDLGNKGNPNEDPFTQTLHLNSTSKCHFSLQ